MARGRAAGWARVARIVLAPLLVAAILWWADPGRVIQVVANADPAWLLAGLSASTLSNLVSAQRWRALAGWLGHRIGAIAAAGVYFRAIAINALLPGAIVGGDVYRAVTLNRRGLPALEAGLSVFLDRLSGLWMLVVLGMAAAAWGVADTPAQELVPAVLRAPGAGALAALAACLLAAPALAIVALGKLGAALGGVARPASAWRARLDAAAQRPGIWRQYALQIIASLAVQVLSIGAFALGGHALGIELAAWSWAAAAVPVFLMATLPVSFGGWGTREAAAVVALSAFGVPAAPAVGASVLYGLFGLMQAAAGGLLLARDPRETHRATVRQ
ncbi:MAG: lysylphosphatidylglycerol synthase transmembrane domain-containing protein [Burkholderiaceae bacterium]